MRVVAGIEPLGDSACLGLVTVDFKIEDAIRISDLVEDKAMNSLGGDHRVSTPYGRAKEKV